MTPQPSEALSTCEVARSKHTVVTSVMKKGNAFEGKVIRVVILGFRNFSCVFFGAYQLIWPEKLRDRLPRAVVASDHFSLQGVAIFRRARHDGMLGVAVNAR